jgi:glycine/D-amino acid oxidase-like deaminating enzyme
MRELAGDAFRPVGSIFAAASEPELEFVEIEADALEADGFAVRRLRRDELPEVMRAHFLGGLFHPTDGLLEPGRWVRRRAAQAAEAGAKIAEGTRALSLHGTDVVTEHGTVSATTVVLATDGYTYGLAPELDEVVKPARAQMLATVPLAERYFEPAIYVREGWDYWQQTRDGRILIGGWRDTELENEFTRDDGPTEAIQVRIEDFLERLLGERPAVTHRWAGLLGFTSDLLPLVGPLPGRDGVWLSLGYSGHGNVLALACGEALAHAILGTPDPRLAALSPERILAARAPA